MARVTIASLQAINAALKAENESLKATNKTLETKLFQSSGKGQARVESAMPNTQLTMSTALLARKAYGSENVRRSLKYGTIGIQHQGQWVWCTADTMADTLAKAGWK